MVTAGITARIKAAKGQMRALHLGVDATPAHSLREKWAIVMRRRRG